MVRIITALVISWAIDISLLTYVPMNEASRETLVTWLFITMVIPVFLVLLSRRVSLGHNRLLMREYRNNGLHEGKCPRCSGGRQSLNPDTGEWGPIPRFLFDSVADKRGIFTNTITVRLCRRCGGSGTLITGDGSNDDELREVRNGS